MPLAGDTIEAGRIPGWRIATSIENTFSATFTTTETVIGSVTAPLVTGYTYDVVTIAKLGSDADGDVALASIREDNVSGTLIDRGYNVLATTTNSRAFQVPLRTRYTAIATGNKTFVVTAFRVAGTGNILRNASATAPQLTYVEYVSG